VDQAWVQHRCRTESGRAVVRYSTGAGFSFMRAVDQPDVRGCGLGPIPTIAKT
jgi:hypothetical protein